jgi:hypothetical protein
MPPSKRYLLFIPLLLALLFGLRRSWSSPPSDFAGYYYGGRALIHGDYPGAYDMTRLNDRIAADGYHDVFVSYTPFPPFTSLVFSPFMIFPMRVAKPVFNVLGIALFLFTLFRITRCLSTPPWLILALPVIFFIPLLNNLAFGQSYLLLFALLGEGWLAARRQQRILSSFLWAAAILFKLFPAFLFLFLLLRRRYRETLYLGIGCAILLLTSVLINGITAWKFYVFTIIPRMNHGELNDSFTYVFQSGFMLLKRAFQSDRLLNPHPIADNPWLFTLGMAVFKSVLLTTAVMLTRRAKEDFYPFAVWMAATVLISPNGSSYSLVLLILPLLGLAASPSTVPAIPETVPARPACAPTPSLPHPSMPAVLAALVLTAACAIPVTRFGAYPLLAQFPRLYLLLLFYAILCARRPSWNLALVTGLAALFFVLDIRGNLPEKDPSAYVLTKEAHLFIDSFSARGNRLVYYWRDSNGDHEESTDYPVHSLTNDSVAVIHNQIWYKGKQVTSTPDNKAGPALVNGDCIIYLSDKDRGYEFYTLRTIRPAAMKPAEIRPAETRPGAPATP